MAKPKTNDSVTLPAPQRNALLAAKSWWQEGDRHLDFFAERSRYRVVLEQAATARDRFRSAQNPTAAEAMPFLRAARAFAPNGAMNRGRETDDFARALHRLLFADEPLAERLSGFLHTVHGVGALTASQLLFAAYPDRYPFATAEARAALGITNQQRRAARDEAEKRYGASEELPVVNLLTTFVWFEIARALTKLPDFADLDAVLRHAHEMPKNARRRAAERATTVREPEARYETTPAVAPEPEEEITSEATEADLLRYIEGFARTQGFTYPALAVRNYYLCLKTKPFVILAGLSGTGKTRLTELLAEAVTANLRSRYRLFPVRPDWNDPAPLLGYHNALTGTYIGTPFLDVVQDAARGENRERAYFVCLDEMNLARAEHYLADILSAMETRSREIPLSGSFDVATLAPNVFLSGTVNMEEGTHPFGLKVLDRANVIEFASADMSRPSGPAAPIVLPEIAPAEREQLFLSNRVETVAEAEDRLNAVSPAIVERFYAVLTALNEQLTDRNLPFGYRVRDEALRYVAHVFGADGIPLLVDGGTAEENAQTAMDLQIVQKVLPRVGGTQERLSRFLLRLAEWADGENFERTATKLRRMHRRAEEEGIVSFWE